MSKSKYRYINFIFTSLNQFFFLAIDAKQWDIPLSYVPSCSMIQLCWSRRSVVLCRVMQHDTIVLISTFRCPLSRHAAWHNCVDLDVLLSFVPSCSMTQLCWSWRSVVLYPVMQHDKIVLISTFRCPLSRHAAWYNCVDLDQREITIAYICQVYLACMRQHLFLLVDR